MMCKDAPHLSKLLKESQELEGKVFLHLWSKAMDGQVMVSQDIYRVENNKVYRLTGDNSDIWDETKDTLWSVKSECKLIGDYDPSETYVNKLQWFDASALSDKIFNIIEPQQ